MGKLSFLKPLDQPTGKRRLLDELRQQLKSVDLDDLWIMVAYAKAGPLLRLEEEIKTWKRRGGRIHATIGIDQLGTSTEALTFALRNFDSVRIAHAPAEGGSFHPTFHPKLYLFVGKNRAIAYVGSNNLTVGGMETNFEASTIVSLDRPADDAQLDEILECWNDAQNASVVLTKDVLEELVKRGLVTGEKEQRRLRKLIDGAKRAVRSTIVSEPIFPPFSAQPPSPLPAAKRERPEVKLSAGAPAITATAEALVIQIVPHENGEVFLSKRAVDQNPSFFGWPFTGRTVPKKAGNAPYPERTPDPIANIEVFDASGKCVLVVKHYGINTVYYSEKSEIRMTFRPDIVAATPARSVLVMRDPPPAALYDYDMSIYAPGSKDYDAYLAVCNQTMPSGGARQPRRFGWL